MHPIVTVQAGLVAALRADAGLVALIGTAVFDAPPRDRRPPYVLIARHDVVQADFDLSPGQEHRILLHCWADQPSRKAALAIAERVVAVAHTFSVSGVVLTTRSHVRTDSAIDAETGLAKAAVTLRIMSE